MELHVYWKKKKTDNATRKWFDFYMNMWCRTISLRYIAQLLIKNLWHRIWQEMIPKHAFIRVILQWDDFQCSSGFSPHYLLLFNPGSAFFFNSFFSCWWPVMTGILTNYSRETNLPFHFNIYTCHNVTELFRLHPSLLYDYSISGWLQLIKFKQNTFTQTKQYPT